MDLGTYLDSVRWNLSNQVSVLAVYKLAPENDMNDLNRKNPLTPIFSRFESHWENIQINLNSALKDLSRDVKHNPIIWNDLNLWHWLNSDHFFDKDTYNLGKKVETYLDSALDLSNDMKMNKIGKKILC